MAQPINDYYIITSPGLERVCVAELQALNMQANACERGGIAFSGGLRELYLASLWLRTASRILVRFAQFRVRDFPTLYQRLARLPWGRFIKPECSCKVQVSTKSSRLNHGGRIGQTCQAAIDQALGRQPLADAEQQLVYVRIVDDMCQISIDSSGDLLHRRGYRRARTAAPMRETLAAACLLACGYDGEKPLVDLMTGSGTFALEGALIAMRRAPGLKRDFAFMRWPKFRHGLWLQLCQEAEKKQRPAPVAPIVAMDNNPRAIAAAGQNITSALVCDWIDLRLTAMQDLALDCPPGLVICNPPYGERLGRNATLDALYADLGSVYRGRYRAWQRAVFCPDNNLLQRLGIPLRPLLRTLNGGLPVGLFEASDSADCS